MSTFLLHRASVEEHLRKRYQCSTCRKSWSSKKRAIEHIAECIKDPFTRSCPTCRHDFKGEPEVGAGAGCDLGVREEGVNCKRWCDDWEASRWLSVAFPSSQSSPQEGVTR